MGIYIPGVELRKDRCMTIRIYPKGADTSSPEFWAKSVTITAAEAILVPPHGRLGDLDRLAKEVEDMGKEFPPDSIGAEWYRLFAEFIKTAPTIIPEEEGE